MNIRDLQYFLAVAELEHFGHAAEQCFVSQPTLSGQIKKLEEELGIKLFERTNRRVILTETGQQVSQSAKRILREVEAINDVAQSAQEPLTGKLRIGAFPTLATYIFPKLVTKVNISLPNIRLILMEEKTADLLDKLKHGEIDLALLALPINDDFFVSRKLFDDEFYLAVPKGHKLTESDTVDQKNLYKYRLLLLEEGHCLREQALDICSLHGINEEQDFKATGMETLRQMVKAGTGITFMPKVAINEDDQDISYLPFSAPAPKRTIGLVWRKTSTKLEVIDKLIEIMKQA
ncbi:LysR substrate-binding domain-containing protein [Pseudomonadota bacterium]|nr:LysR substrate-binding domain-containing protein [Pseudomonadota bacterium]